MRGDAELGIRVRLALLEGDRDSYQKRVRDLEASMLSLESRLDALEAKQSGTQSDLFGTIPGTPQTYVMDDVPSDELIHLASRTLENVVDLSAERDRRAAIRRHPSRGQNIHDRLNVIQGTLEEILDILGGGDPCSE